MKGFIVFEVAPPFRWKPKYERDPNGGQFHRVIWAWFSITLVYGMKWTEFIDRLMNSKPEIHTVEEGHDEHETLGIG